MLIKLFLSAYFVYGEQLSTAWDNIRFLCINVFKLITLHIIGKLLNLLIQSPAKGMY